MGLMGVVGLPRAFVFRVSADDPHPAPWIRVKLSAALGQAFYPQPSWGRLADLWESFYPFRETDPELRTTLTALERTIPELVALLTGHRQAGLQGYSLMEALRVEDLDPARLRNSLEGWRSAPQGMYRERPIVAMAAIGQGRADGRITPEEESIVLGKLLTHWALKSTLQAAAGCARAPSHRCKCQGSRREERISTSTRRTSWQIQ
jgi:hypothetical protein